MVDYFSAGIQWATPAGKPQDPATACGITVAVQNGTTQQLDDGPAKSKACTDAGKEKIDLLGFDTQDDATAAVILGRADAVTADSPVIQYAVKQSGGKLSSPATSTTSSSMECRSRRTRPAWPTPRRGARLAQGRRHLHEDPQAYGVEQGALDAFEINGADR